MAYFKPLKVFIPISVLLLLSGFLLLVYFFVSGVLYDTTIAILFVSSIQVALFGILADMMIKLKLGSFNAKSD